MPERSRVTHDGLLLLSEVAGVNLENAQAALAAHPEWQAKLADGHHVHRCECGARWDEHAGEGA
jgi:hypothetical protein